MSHRASVDMDLVNDVNDDSVAGIGEQDDLLLLPATLRENQTSLPGKIDWVFPPASFLHHGAWPG